jgi:predicted phosphodiesterase
MRKPTPSNDQAREYIGRFAGSPKQAVARALHRDFPELYPTVEVARSAVRTVTGANGKNNITNRTIVSHGHQSATFKRMPEGIRDIDDFEPFPIEPGRTLVLNDVHIPFHDRAAVEVAVGWGKKRGADTILLNGDIVDCYAQSRWETDPRKRKLKDEVDMTKQFFGWLRGKFPQARIVWKFGNHEERHERYVMVRCPELLSLPMMALDRICGAADFGIETVREMQPITLGNLYALHGHEYKFAISNPVNPARGLYLRSKKSTISGHFHQESSHTESDISSDITTCWSVACLCDLHPRYMPLNKWSHGAARVEHQADGSFSVENKRIFRGALL